MPFISISIRFMEESVIEANMSECWTPSKKKKNLEEARLLVAFYHEFKHLCSKSG